MTARGLARRIEFGDLLVPLYAVVFVRQCLWGVSNEIAAWTITSVVTLLGWFAYLYTKPATEERTPRIFWLLLALPLLIIFAARAPIPDLSFDVLNHRLIQGERALRGPQFLADRSFPLSRFVVVRVGRWLRRLSLDPERDDQSRGFDRHSDARSAAVDSGISTDPPGDCP